MAVVTRAGDEKLSDGDVACSDERFLRANRLLLWSMARVRRL